MVKVTNYFFKGYV